MQVIDELGLTHQVGDVLTEVRLAVELQVRFRGPGAPLDAGRAVEQHHAVGQRLHRAAHVRQRVREALLALRRVALEAVERGERFVPCPGALGNLAGDRIGQPAAQAREVPSVPEEPGEQRQYHERGKRGEELHQSVRKP